MQIIRISKIKLQQRYITTPIPSNNSPLQPRRVINHIGPKVFTHRKNIPIPLTIVPHRQIPIRISQQDLIILFVQLYSGPLGFGVDGFNWCDEAIGLELKYSNKCLVTDDEPIRG